MKTENGMTKGQHIAACCLSVFSPISRLLPKAVLYHTGRTGWLSPLPALPMVFGLVWFVGKLLRHEGHQQGMAQMLETRLGRKGGALAALILCIWLVFYGGFLLRSGVERLLSTVYSTGSLYFFLPVLLLLSVTFALGRIRTMGRCSAVTLLLFAQVLILVFVMSLPTVKTEYVWPVEIKGGGRFLLSALPVLDVLSPWVWFSFLQEQVSEEANEKRKTVAAILLLFLLTMLFLLCTIGILGPEMSRKLQYPFFIMVKNLHIFNVAERFDALVIVVWIMTDYVCIGMLLRSASEGLRVIFHGEKHTGYVLLCGAAMLTIGFLIAPNALVFEKISEKWVPTINLLLVVLGLPLIWLLGEVRKNLKKRKIGVDNSG